MPRPSELPPTAAQHDYLQRLSRSRGVHFGAPRSRGAASAQIAALTAMPAFERRIERDCERDVTSMGTLAPFHDDEIEGYGASARWRR